MITEIHTQEEFQKEIANRKGIALIDFWAVWCGPCRMMAPVVEAADQVLGDTIHFTKIDVDELQDVASGFDIMSIPTFVILQDGVEISRLVGAMSTEEFVSQLKNVLA